MASSRSPANVRPDLFDSGGEEPLEVLRRKGAADGGGDLLGGQSGGDQRVLVELPAELIGVEPPGVLEQGQQQVIDDEGVGIGFLKLVREKVGACNRGVRRLDRERDHQREEEDDAEPRGPSAAYPDDHPAILRNGGLRRE